VLAEAVDLDTVMDLLQLFQLNKGGILEQQE
jgi:hypothetical protein